MDYKCGGFDPPAAPLAHCMMIPVLLSLESVTQKGCVCLSNVLVATLGSAFDTEKGQSTTQGSNVFPGEQEQCEVDELQSRKVKGNSPAERFADTRPSWELARLAGRGVRKGVRHHQ